MTFKSGYLQKLCGDMHGTLQCCAAQAFSWRGYKFLKPRLLHGKQFKFRMSNTPQIHVLASELQHLSQGKVANVTLQLRGRWGACQAL